MPETAQPTAETAEQKSRGLGSYVVWAFVAVMVYVLSSGPAKLARLYTPVWWIYDNTLAHKPLGMYLHVWMPDKFDQDGEQLGWKCGSE